MPRVSDKRSVENDISEYLVKTADIIEMDNAPDDEILDAIEPFFDDLSYWGGRKASGIWPLAIIAKWGIACQ